MLLGYTAAECRNDVLGELVQRILGDHQWHKIADAFLQRKDLVLAQQRIGWLI